MSLIHWWPLNGDTKDYGINNLNGSLIGSTSFDNAGKIGRCLLADTGSLYSGRGVTIPSNLVNELSGKDYSFCAWVKVNGSHVHYEGAIISSGNWNNSCWAFGLNQDNTAINPAGSWYNTSYVSYAFEVGKWYHIVSVQKSGTNYVYVNGSLVGSVGHSPISQSDASDTCIGRETYAGGYFGFNGYINDVRIYNHALSVKEVKEISKGLVLHYNFEDVYVEGTTNLNSANWNAYSSYWTITSQTIDEITLVSQGTSHGTVAIYNNFVKNQLAPSSQITVSGYLYKDGVPYKCTDPTLTPYNGWTTSKFESRSDGYFRYTGSFTNLDSTWIIHTPLFGAPASGTVCKIKNLQWENKDHATPYVNGTRQPGLIYDNSGYGYNGTQVDCSIVEPSDNQSGKRGLRTNTSGYVQLPEIFLDKTFTISTWCKHLDSFSTWARIFDFGNATSGQNYDIGLATSDSSGTTYLFGRVAGGNLPDKHVDNMDFNWHLFTIVVDYDSIKYYKDGVLVDSFAANGDVGGVLYTLNYLNKSNWSGDGVSNKYYADFKIFNTALSAGDILLEYNRKASIDKTGKLFAPYIEEYENTGNIGELANYYIETQHAFDGRFGPLKESDYNAYYPNGQPGLGTYEQGNLIVTMTNQGIRIYSEPNRDGRSQEGSEWNTWGGFCWSPMKQSRCLIKGHHYRLSWHVKGQSSRAMTDVYWSNQIGWGQYPDASPTVHKAVTHPANFQGEMDCFYDFTIEDDIFKTTTDDVHAGFEPNTSYLAYSAFKIGYTYDFTGPLGTDIYITNLQLHDLTTGDVYKIGENGVVKTTEVISGRRDSARLHSDGVIDVTDIIEN